MTDEASWVYLSLTDRLARPYEPPPDGTAVAFGLNQEGIDVLRVLLDTSEEILVARARAHVPSREQS